MALIKAAVAGRTSSTKMNMAFSGASCGNILRYKISVTLLATFCMPPFHNTYLDSLSNDIDKLTNSQVRGDQVLLLVNQRYICPVGLFADDLVGEVGRNTMSVILDPALHSYSLPTYWNAVRILLTNAFCFSFALL
jgi:hypothetical protein